jgi:hypothetical protein
MITLKLRIHLLSDAEPGTGLGNETINALVPTDSEGNPIIPASHLKGLLRDEVHWLARIRDWSPDVAAGLFGEPGDTATDGVGAFGVLSLGDARTKGKLDPITITRTRIGPLGTADANSLRTVQAIPAGTEFSVKVHIDAAVGSVADLVLRLAAMSIEALGGGRTRGAGACRISIDEEDRSPGTLLRLVNDAAQAFELERPDPKVTKGHSIGAGDAQWFRLIFTARTPICCPEIPINGSTNHVRSGPVIPASAVQGALISHIDRENPALATACLLDPRFRAWPLVPVLDLRDAEGLDPKQIPLAVRVDLSHRMSKLKEKDDRYRFADPAVDGRHWSESSSGSPLKSSDGILCRHQNGEVYLWRAVELPRHITAHGVHQDPSGRRNLFSVEALAPMVFTGVVALPPEASDCLRELLQQDGTASFGNARSIRGKGILSLEPAQPGELFSSEWPAEAPGRVFVVQSPLAIPDDYRFTRGEDPVSAEEALAELASSWGEVELKTPRSIDGKPREVARTTAACGVRFGWNRHGLGTRADERHRRLRARRVFLPGTVIVFAEPVTDLESKLLTGLGEGREAGFGGLLPHPGVAQGVYRPHENREPARLTSRDKAGTEGHALFAEAGKANGPSPSQIGKLASLARVDSKKALEHLAKQMRRGPARHWYRWEPVTGRLETLLKNEPELARAALRVWQDLAVIHRPERKES